MLNGDWQERVKVVKIEKFILFTYDEQTGPDTDGLTGLDAWFWS
jgi:hypothetical protein